MKIITASKFYYLRGGLEAYLFKISDILKDHGHEVIPFSTKHSKRVKSKFDEFFTEYLDLGGESRLNLNKKLKAFTNIFYNFEAQEKISKLIEQTKPDLLWGFGIHRHLSPSIFIVAKKNSIPVIHRLSDYALICPDTRLFRGDNTSCSELLCPLYGYHNAIKHGCVRRSSLNNSEKRTSIAASIIAAMEVYLHRKFQAYIDNVNMFIAPSEFLKNTMIKGGIPKEKITHIPIFIDPAKYNHEFDSQPYLVYFGRLTQEKGLHILLEAMSNLKHHKLLIIGNGPQKEYLEQLIAKKNLINVRLLGQMHSEQLARVVRNSRLVIVPSIWYDNSPNVILEAFALGKPVLGADIGGIPEYIEENVNGMLYQYNNSKELEEKIDFLMNQSSFCKEMGKAARKTVLIKYNPKTHYDQVMKVIGEITRIAR